jgi:hypothetical protein
MQFNNPRRHLFDHDALWLGIVIGIVFPVIMYGVLLSLFDSLELYVLPPEASFSRGFRFRTLPLLAICANLIPFHLYRKWGRDKTMRGLIFPTLGYVLYWFVEYGRHMIGL